MPKSKTRKNHSQKVKNRNERLEHQKNQIDKLRRNFLNELIKKEQEQGAFDNTKSLIDNNDGLLEGPTI